MPLSASDLFDHIEATMLIDCPIYSANIPYTVYAGSVRDSV